jgi:hypothetical protein
MQALLLRKGVADKCIEFVTIIFIIKMAQAYL